MDLFQPLFKNEAEAVAKRRLRPAEWKITDPKLFVSRCAAHADEVVKFYQDGTQPPKRPYVTDWAMPLKARHNEYVATQLAKNPFPVATLHGSPNIFDAMTSDVSRSHVVINGQTFAKDDATDYPAVYSAFKKALPAEKAQKAVSSLMHQGGLGDLTLTLMKHPILPDDGDPLELFNLPGADLLFQRDMTDDNAIFSKPQFDANQAPDYDLEVSPDGNTAVLTMRMESPIMMGHAANEDEGFGTLQLTQKLTIDLAPDVPVVTDVKISQYINS